MNSTSLEQEVKRFLNEKKVSFEDNSASYTHLDFVILFKGEPYFYLEVKEKRRRYNAKNWPPFAEEVDLFIIDDLTVRKCLAHAPRSGVLVRDSGRDNGQDAYFFFSVIDLALMPRLRVNREIRRKASGVKGKWLINLRNGVRAGNIEGAFAALRAYVEKLDDDLFTATECHGDYVGEEVAVGGTVRKSFYWNRDVQSTR